MTMLAPHLNAEQLSDAVDGTPDAATVAHLQDCEVCRTEAETWRRKLSEVWGLEPVRSSPEEIGDAVARALAAASSDLPLDPAGPVSGGGATVHRLPPPPSTPPSPLVSSGADSASEQAAAPISLGARRRRRWAPRLVGAAAAVVVIGAVVAVAVGRSSSHTNTATPSPASAANRPPTSFPISSRGQVLVASDPTELRGELKAQVAKQTAHPQAVPTSTPCYQTALTRVGSRPFLQQPVLYRHIAVQVYVFSAPGRVVALVLSAPSCRVITQLTL